MRQLSIFTEEECEAVATSAFEVCALKLVTVNLFLKVYFRGVLFTVNFTIFECIVKETCTISHTLQNDVIFIVLQVV